MHTVKTESDPTDITIHIPVAIAALPNLDLIERVILARVDECPASRNSDLAPLTGLSQRGIESTLARLRERDLIEVTGKGRARRLRLGSTWNTTPNVVEGSEGMVT